MSNNPPRRPPGPPPPRPPVDGAPRPATLGDTTRGSGMAPARPVGPPPNITPLTSIKPPPRAPPPIALQQTQQRPPVSDTQNTMSSTIPPPSKPPINFPSAPAKAGGISMFEEVEEKSIKRDEPAEKKTKLSRAQESAIDLKGIPLSRGLSPADAKIPTPGTPLVPTLGRNTSSRPQPPTSLSAGIPAGQPQPPAFKPETDARPPPPVKPPPKNRAPPREEPSPSPSGSVKSRVSSPLVPSFPSASQKASAAPAPPSSEPPFIRGKKPAVEKAAVKRRERDMPEFEESDDDEEKPDLVRQPKPFGVLKQPVPPSPMELAAMEEKRKKEADKEAAARLLDDKPSLERPGSAMPEPADAKVKAASSLAGMLGIRGKEAMEAPPPVTQAESRVSEFAPPPPTDSSPSLNLNLNLADSMDKFFDDSKLGKKLTLGRLSMKCIQGFDIKKKDEKDPNARLDPFVKFRLGVAERHPWKKTETKRKQNSTPKFDDEIVFFNITDPGQFIFQEDIQLCIEVWNKGTLADELIGSVTMSVVRFLLQPFVAYTEKVPVYYPGIARTQMKMLIEFVFEEARSGLFQITLFEGRDLRNIDPMGHQDPFVQLSLGASYKKRSKCIKGGSTSPFFNEEDILMWVDQDNWVNDMAVDVLDEDAKEEKPIGTTHFSLLPYMKILPQDAKEDSYDLFHFILTDPKDEASKKEVAKGELVMRIRFLPAGNLTLEVDRAKALTFPEAHKAAMSSGESLARMDPYVKLSLEGKAVKVVKRTPADKDGGTDPVWQEQVSFEVVDQYLLDIEVYNQSVTGKDVLLGFTQLSLLSIYRTGHSEFWSSLKQKKANGGVKEVGDIFLKFSFVGPAGIAFPQFRPEVDSFDDTLRKIPGATKDADADAAPADFKTAISTIPDEKEEAGPEYSKRIQEQKDQADRDGIPPEFTDAEIMAAFKFIDLDHNNFVGAAEIRHILVCMGEMITDEEIDMMISMVDLDGDGQVSYKEFRALVLHPNPGVVDLLKEVHKANENDVLKEKQALAGKKQGVDHNAFHRQKEMTQREQKKKMIAQFVIDNEVNFDYIKQAYLDFVELPKDKRPGGRVKFQEFCKVLRIEPITDYKNLHAFYDTEEMGDMDLREFLLSMMNFVDVRKDERVAFSFNMFDEAKTGFISQREVEEILRGNHMISIASVQRKAETIMKQAHKNSSGAITLNEFVIVSKKFPNILLPAVGYVPAADAVKA